MEDTNRGGLLAYLAACRSMRPADRRNVNVATGLLLAWAVSFGAGILLLKRGVVPEGPLAYLLVAVPIGLAILAVLAYVRFLRRADELHSKIQFEALALGFGAGFVATFGFSLLEAVGAHTFTLADPFSVMVVFYMVGLFVGARRYA